MSSAGLIEQLEVSFRECRDKDLPLAERLGELAGAVRRISPPFADAVDRLVASLQRNHVGEHAPGVGDAMPPFLLPDDRGNLVSLEQLLGRGPAAITFLRSHWCPYCRLNAYALARVQRKVADMGGCIVAITPDLQRYAERLKSEADAVFPVLTDIDNGYALSLNLVFRLSDEMAKFIAATGIDIPAAQGSPAWTLPVPATFVAGQDGLIRARFVDPDYRKRMALRDMLVALEGARH